MSKTAEKINQFHAPGIGFQLQEGGKAPKEVQILRRGTFHHPAFGAIGITDKLFDSFIENFKKKSFGIEIMMDFSHNTDGEAAGWIKKLFKNDKGLFAEVEWTPKGREKVEAKAFAYTSADFTDNFTDRETLEQFGPLLRGAALTNRPFVKKMSPTMELSESKQGEEDMAQPNLEELTSSVQKLTEQQVTLSDKVTGLEGDNTKLTTENADLKKKLSDSTEKIEASKVATAEAAKKGEFDKMLSDNKAVEAQREAYMTGNMKQFTELAVATNTDPAGNAGAGQSKDTEIDKLTPEQAEDKVAQMSEELSKKDGIDLDTATERVLSDNPKLCKKYEQKFE